MSRSTKVRGIIVLDGRLLCVQLRPYNGLTIDKDPYWCLPGGGVDDGEAILEAMHREMLEELGVAPKVGRLLYIQQFSDNGENFLDLFFHIENAEDYRNIDLSKTTHGQKEIDKIDFVDPKTTYILPKFLTTENLPEFIASNQPVKFFAA